MNEKLQRYYELHQAALPAGAPKSTVKDNMDGTVDIENVPIFATNDKKIDENTGKRVPITRADLEDAVEAFNEEKSKTDYFPPLKEDHVDSGDKIGLIDNLKLYGEWIYGTLKNISKKFYEEVIKTGKKEYLSAEYYNFSKRISAVALQGAAPPEIKMPPLSRALCYSEDNRGAIYTFISKLNLGEDKRMKTTLWERVSNFVLGKKGVVTPDELKKFAEGEGAEDDPMAMARRKGMVKEKGEHPWMADAELGKLVDDHLAKNPQEYNEDGDDDDEEEKKKKAKKEEEEKLQKNAEDEKKKKDEEDEDEKKKKEDDKVDAEKEKKYTEQIEGLTRKLEIMESAMKAKDENVKFSEALNKAAANRAIDTEKTMKFCEDNKLNFEQRMAYLENMKSILPEVPVGAQNYHEQNLPGEQSNPKSTPDKAIVEKIAKFAEENKVSFSQAYDQMITKGEAVNVSMTRFPELQRVQELAKITK